MLAVGCDHIGLQIKEELLLYLDEMGISYRDFGCNTPERTDYPKYAYKVARAVADGDCEAGLLLCGTGVGISIAANKVHGIRAVVCSDPYSAMLSKTHNNTNVLALGSRVVGAELAKMILRSWLEAEFEGGRHQKRIDMIARIEQNQGMWQDA